jgi:hypothetical protein
LLIFCRNQQFATHRFRIRDAKARRSAEAGRDSVPWPTTPIAVSQPMSEIG